MCTDSESVSLLTIEGMLGRLLEARAREAPRRLYLYLLQLCSSGNTIGARKKKRPAALSGSVPPSDLSCRTRDVFNCLIRRRWLWELRSQPTAPVSVPTRAGQWLSRPEASRNAPSAPSDVTDPSSR